MYDIKTVLNKIINDSYQVKINYKYNPDGTVFLYLNYRKMINGIRKQRTKRINITLNGENLKNDLKLLKQAFIFREEFEKTLYTGKDNVFNNIAESTFLSDYIDIMITHYTKKNSVKSLKSTKNHLIKFAGSNITLKMIDKSFCFNFLKYLSKNVVNSGYIYFQKFKQILYTAIADELIPDLPYIRQMSIKKIKAKREFLTQEELSKLYHTQTKYEEYKNAFVFGCFTGLRFVDLFKLKFSDINDDKIRIIQQKTKEELEIKLHSTAIEIINKQKQFNNDLIFNISSYEIWRRNILTLSKEAGITKKITGHCARHTFATLCITYGIDIYTVSKLLGHTDIKHTQIYAKLIDKKKDEAIDKLPEI